MHDPLKVISEVSELISVGSDRSLNLNPILDAAVAGLGATKAFLFLNPWDEEKMALAASSGLSVAEFRRLDLAAESSILREIVSESSLKTFDGLTRDDNLGFLSDDARGKL